jgi:hypothetical protein
MCGLRFQPSVSARARSRGGHGPWIGWLGRQVAEPLVLVTRLPSSVAVLAHQVEDHRVVDDAIDGRHGRHGVTKPVMMPVSSKASYAACEPVALGDE